MEAWISDGVQLRWLVDPYERRVWIYRSDAAVELLDDPRELLGGDVCPGLRVDCSRVWPADSAARSSFTMLVNQRLLRL